VLENRKGVELVVEITLAEGTPSRVIWGKNTPEEKYAECQ
jgi:hypothetical protein